MDTEYKTCDTICIYLRSFPVYDIYGELININYLHSKKKNVVNLWDRLQTVNDFISFRDILLGRMNDQLKNYILIRLEEDKEDRDNGFQKYENYLYKYLMYYFISKQENNFDITFRKAFFDIRHWMQIQGRIFTIRMKFFLKKINLGILDLGL